MEENSKKVVDTEFDKEGGVTESPWVSPEMAAAMAGEQVEMGKNLDENEERTDSDG